MNNNKELYDLLELAEHKIDQHLQGQYNDNNYALGVALSAIRKSLTLVNKPKSFITKTLPVCQHNNLCSGSTNGFIIFSCIDCGLAPIFPTDQNLCLAGCKHFVNGECSSYDQNECGIANRFRKFDIDE